MSALKSLIPSADITQTEQDIIVEAFKIPAVKKYLQIMALNDVKELADISSVGRSAEEVALLHENVRGKLSTLATLMSLSTFVVSTQGETKCP